MTRFNFSILPTPSLALMKRPNTMINLDSVDDLDGLDDLPDVLGEPGEVGEAVLTGEASEKLLQEPCPTEPASGKKLDSPSSRLVR